MDEQEKPVTPIVQAVDWSQARQELEKYLDRRLHTFGVGNAYNHPLAVFYADSGPNGYEVWSTRDGQLDHIVFHIFIIGSQVPTSQA